MTDTPVPPPREGHFILFVRYGIGFVFAYLCLIGVGLWAWSSLNEQHAESAQVRIQLQVTYDVLQARYRNTPAEEWPALTTQLQRQFSFPLHTIGWDSASNVLDADRVARLRRGDLVGSPDGRHAYQRLGDSNEVLTLGDLVTLDWQERPWYDDDHLDDVVLVAILVVAIVLPLYFLVYRLWRDVYALGNMAMAIRNGDFNATTPAISTRLVRPLKMALCSMASQLQEVMEGQRILSQAVAHETRTPLSRMRFALAMLRVDDDPEGRELLEGLKTDVSRLEQLASAGMAYAQFGRSTRVVPKRIIIASLFDELRDTFEVTSATTPVLHFLRPLPQTVAGNRDALLLALRNLIGNAQRHATAEVIISARASNNRIVFAVDDDGPGVPVPDRHRVFQPYVQLQRHADGFGLGLALVQIIAAKHGGSAGVSDSVLGGARFQLVIPQG